MKKSIKAADYQDAGNMTIENSPKYKRTLQKRVELLRQIFDAIEELDDNGYELLVSWIEDEGLAEGTSDCLRENAIEYERLTGSSINSSSKISKGQPIKAAVDYSKWHVSQVSADILWYEEYPGYYPKTMISDIEEAIANAGDEGYSVIGIDAESLDHAYTERELKYYIED